MKGNAKQKILEAGAAIIHRKGYNHTGIQEVLRAAGVPKGSFYFYFKNKEAFGLEVIDYFNNHFREIVTPFIANDSLGPLARLEGILDQFIQFFTGMAFTNGCPIGNLAQEMGDLSPAFQDKLRAALDGMTSLFAGLLEQAREAGELAEGIDIGETAVFIVSSWHGALIRMKIVQGPEPLESHKKILMNHILAR